MSTSSILIGSIRFIIHNFQLLTVILLTVFWVKMYFQKQKRLLYGFKFNWSKKVIIFDT